MSCLPNSENLRFVGAIIVALTLIALPAAATDDDLLFVGVEIDEETTGADEKLLRVLLENKGLRFPDGPRQHSYEEVINALRGLSGEGHVLEPETRDRFVARATPYVLVAAQMLGAQVEVLATYTNPEGRATYGSNFVVNRKQFQQRYGEATRASLLRFLEEAEEPIRFVYHDRFSTSSFFLPSLFFRSNSIVSASETVGSSQTAIDSFDLSRQAGAEEKKPGSTDLVRAVAAGRYDLAAVWDGTRRKFEEGGALFDELGSEVMFIPLGEVLPNDLLVAPTRLDSTQRSRIKRAIEGMGDDDIGLGDFASWKTLDSDQGKKACTALATLRIAAQDQLSSPAVVKIQADSSHLEPLLEAVENAVRRMGYDYTLFDEAFHDQYDVLWTLRGLHDDGVVSAIELTSRIEHSGLDPQSIPISFDSRRNLTQRIVDVARTRLHRIGYVWPYSRDSATVIHDFDLTPEDSVRVLALRRGDPRRNEYKLLGGKEVEIAVKKAGEFRLELDTEEFARTLPPDLNLDPLNNVVYRVVLPQPVVDRTLFRALIACLVGLFVLVAVGFIWDLWKSLREQPKTDELRQIDQSLAPAA